jgi:rhodanese-related sulfurtransferase
VLDFLIQNWMLVLLALTSGALLLWPQFGRGVGGGGATRVDTAEAVRLMNREKAVMIDVSEPDEFAKGHPNGARNVPLGRLEGAKELPSNKALPLIVVCPTGARAGRAVALLRKAGYERAHSLAGGLAAWRDANLPVEKSAT